MRIGLKGPEAILNRMSQIEKKMAVVTGGREYPRQTFQAEGALPVGIPSSEFGAMLQGEIGSKGLAPMRPMLGGIAPAAGGADIRSLIAKVATEEGVEPALLEALVSVESNFNPRAVSAVGAQGLTQLMPGTARALGVNDAFDPEQNLRGGARYLKQMMNQFGDLPTALAAYNAGPGNVTKYGGIPPFRETQNYVNKVQQRYGLLASGGTTSAR